MKNEERSRIMRAIKSRDTGPEILVRKLVHRLGFRFRLHRKDLPGRPDLVFVKSRKVIFVNGCFWHGHACARGARVPKTNRAYWQKKIAGNVARDVESIRRLRKLAWATLTIWECETKQTSALTRKLNNFLKKKTVGEVHER